MATPLCGCFFYPRSTELLSSFDAQYLPMVQSSVHSTILSTTTRTVLRQNFVSPFFTNAIEECTYMFPLFDGVSVVGFTCHVGPKVLKGVVTEKQKAKAIFNDAVSNGKTAGLLEQSSQASDVFSTKLGNIPAGSTIVVEIIYIGELKHDAETDGIRFTIPTKIAPRYGSSPFQSLATGDIPLQNNGQMDISVDISMPIGTYIENIQSPSHPISISMGTISTSTGDPPTLNRGHATLSLQSTSLDKDFVVIVRAKESGTPKAILETHPTIPNHRALMVTLVPKFALPATKPEIVFVADRSGSMDGNIPMLTSAMKVFLKSLPMGIKFNICSFGSGHSFLWEKSQAYTEKTLGEAVQYVEAFSANMGGTETFHAIEATIQNRYSDFPLEIILLTDGDIWRQEELFTYVNEEIVKSSGTIRVFPLGIGNGVSHAFIEGLARAGNGFGQSVQSGERFDKRVVKMLRGALSPHINDYTLEVNYQATNDLDDDFELVDKVSDGMSVLVLDDESDKTGSPVTQDITKPTISLYDLDQDLESNTKQENPKDIADDLPVIPYPKILQAPHKIPALYSFSRTVVYLLMSPSSTQKTPISVTLRATSPHGPLELTVPVEILTNPAETIHQLGARKALQDYEEGRGWIFDAKITNADTSGISVKEKFPGRFEDLVKKEAVRLGEQFQVASKWTSFIAVDESTGRAEETVSQNEGTKLRDYQMGLMVLEQQNKKRLVMQRSTHLTRAKINPGQTMPGAFANSVQPPQPLGMAGKVWPNPGQFQATPHSGLFGASHAVAAPSPQFQATPPSSLFGASHAVAASPQFQLTPQPALFGASTAVAASPQLPAAGNYGRDGGSFGGMSGDYGRGGGIRRGGGSHDQIEPLCHESSGSIFMEEMDSSFDSSPSFERAAIHFPDEVDEDETYSPPPTDPADRVLELINEQSFAGTWELTGKIQILSIIGIDASRGQQINNEALLTMLVIVFLETKMQNERGLWELVVEKARASLVGVDLQSLELAAREILK